MAAQKKLQRTLLLMVLDLVLINGAIVVSFLLRFAGSLPKVNFISYLTLWPWLSACTLLLMQVYGLYSVHRKKWSEVFVSLVLVVIWLNVSTMALSFFFRSFSYPRSVFVIAAFIQILLLGVFRKYWWKFERRAFSVRRLLVVGPWAEARDLAGKIVASSHLPPEDLGFLLEREEALQPDLFPFTRMVGTFEQFPLAMELVQPQEVYICSGVPADEKIYFVNHCISTGCPVYVVPDLYEIFISRGRLEQVEDTPVFALLSPLSIPEEWRWLKRLTDIFISAVLLAVLSPLFLAIALLVRLSSKGPVIYRQLRLTEGGRKFYVYKFRTMVEGAEKESGPVLADRDDDRLTAPGRYLRLARLDELPQLYNVLRGDMSLVGPRPERPFFVQQFLRETPEYAFRLQMKSGMTGLAQVAGRYSTGYTNKLKYDLLYVRSYSPLKDLIILFQTVKVIFMRDRAS